MRRRRLTQDNYRDSIFSDRFMDKHYTGWLSAPVRFCTMDYRNVRNNYLALFIPAHAVQKSKCTQVVLTN